MAHQFGQPTDRARDDGPAMGHGLVGDQGRVLEPEARDDHHAGGAVQGRKGRMALSAEEADARQLELSREIP